MFFLVSVYITTQNRPKYLLRALNSLKNQTYKDFEVLICNDASDSKYNEEYENIISEFKSFFKKTTYLVNPNKIGACASRNLLINQASGEYITGLDDDDVFHKQRIELFVASGEIDNYAFMCTNSKTLKENLVDDDIKNTTSGTIITFKDIKNGNPVGNQIFVKREYLQQILGFDPEMPAWQDYDVWFRLIQTFGDAYKINVSTMYIDRVDNRSRITNGSNAYKGYEKFIEKHKLCLDGKNLLNLKYSDLFNRSEHVNLLNKEIMTSFNIFYRVLRYKTKNAIPWLHHAYEKFIK